MQPLELVQCSWCNNVDLGTGRELSAQGWVTLALDDWPDRWFYCPTCWGVDPPDGPVKPDTAYVPPVRHDVFADSVRETVELWRGGMKVVEVARALDVTDATVYRRLKRAGVWVRRMTPDAM